MGPKQTQREHAQEILNSYRTRAAVLCQAHSTNALKYERRNKWFGIPAVILSTVVGSSIFASIAADANKVWITILVGLMSILAAVLSALQTFLRYAELSQTHQKAAASYDVVRRALDSWQLEMSDPSTTQAAVLDAVRRAGAMLNDAGNIAPVISDSLLREASEALRLDMEAHKKMVAEMALDKFSIATE